MTAATGERPYKILGMATRAKVRQYIVVTAVLLVVLTAGSLAFTFQEIDRQYKIAASVVGRTTHLVITAAADWNLRHGGVYVPVTNSAQPDPFLDELLRDLATRQGIRLTKISHARMTRLIAEPLAQERGIRINITGLQPIRPQNGPDEWEARALARLAEGTKEEYEVVDAGDEAVFRFMAPVKADEGCVKCHGKMGYRAGDLIGGIGVSFSYVPFQKLIDRRKSHVYIFHALFFFFSVTVIALFGVNLVDSVGALQDSLARIRRLEGMLPICAKCKNIRMEGRDPFDARSWVAVEKYIRERTDADFTHGLCPQCARELYPDIELGPRGGRTTPEPPPS